MIYCVYVPIPQLLRGTDEMSWYYEIHRMHRKRCNPKNARGKGIEIFLNEF